MTRKYDILIHSLGCEERKQLIESFVDYSSNQERKIVVEETPFLFNSYQLTLGDVVMRKSHSLLTMYASTERGKQPPRLVRRNKPPKSQHVVFFQTTKNKQLLLVRWRAKTQIWDTEEIQIPKWCRAENPERKEKASPLNEFALRGLVGLVKWNTQSRRLVHEEKDNN